MWLRGADGDRVVRAQRAGRDTASLAGEAFNRELHLGVDGLGHAAGGRSTAIALKSRRLAVWYFLAQALAVVGWWLMLAFVPTTREAFAIRGASFVALGAFAVGDLGIIALGSALVGIRGGRGWAVYVAWVVTGSLLYGTCYVIGAAVGGLTSPLGAALMIPASLASVAASVILSRDANTERLPTRPSA